MGIPAWVPLVGTGGLSALGALGGASEADANLQAQQSANATNIRLAQENRDWQEYMSNSAFQRQMSDMRKAGLNPILAKGGSGASVPNSPVASVSPAADKKLSAGIGGFMQQASGAMNTAVQAKQLEVADAQIAVQKADAIATLAQAEQAAASAQATKTGMPTISNKARASAAEADMAIAEALKGKDKAEVERSMVKWDAYIQRGLQLVDGVSNAFSMGRLLKGYKNLPSEAPSKTKEPSKYEKIQQEFSRRKTINQEKKDYGLKK